MANTNIEGPFANLTIAHIPYQFPPEFTGTGHNIVQNWDEFLHNIKFTGDSDDDEDEYEDQNKQMKALFNCFEDIAEANMFDFHSIDELHFRLVSVITQPFASMNPIHSDSLVQPLQEGLVALCKDANEVMVEICGPNHRTSEEFILKLSDLWNPFLLAWRALRQSYQTTVPNIYRVTSPAIPELYIGSARNITERWNAHEQTLPIVAECGGNVANTTIQYYTIQVKSPLDDDVYYEYWVPINVFPPNVHQTLYKFAETLMVNKKRPIRNVHNMGNTVQCPPLLTSLGDVRVEVWGEDSFSYASRVVGSPTLYLSKI